MKDPFNAVAEKQVGLDQRLMDASAKGRTGEVIDLLTQGANPKVADDYQWTPLHLAAREGHDDTVRILVARGADVGARTNFNNKAADLARKAGKTTTEKILLAEEDSRNRRPKNPGIRG